MEAVWGEKTPPIWERMLLSLPCLVYKPVDFKAPKQSITLSAPWQRMDPRAVSFKNPPWGQPQGLFEKS